MNNELSKNQARCRELAIESYRSRNINRLDSYKEKAEIPNIGKMAASASKSMKRWISSGFSKSNKDVIENRLNICMGCKYWDAIALNGTGRCIKCGCSTWAKIRMATERCPLGKWEAVIAK